MQELRNTGEDSEERADLRGRPEKRQCGTCGFCSSVSRHM